MRASIRLRDRPVDFVFLAFFVVNAGFITYFFDIEQLTVAHATHMVSYPGWPPGPVVDLVHWYGNHYDPLLMARPAFFRMMIWVDVLLFGPFYDFAIYAFGRGRDWIRVLALVWSGMMFLDVATILFDERFGDFPTPHFAFVAAANGPWLLLPVAVVARLWRDHPFTRPTATAEVDPVPAVTAA